MSAVLVLEGDVGRRPGFQFAYRGTLAPTTIPAGQIVIGPSVPGSPIPCGQAVADKVALAAQWDSALPGWFQVVTSQSQGLIETTTQVIGTVRCPGTGAFVTKKVLYTESHASFNTVRVAGYRAANLSWAVDQVLGACCGPKQVSTPCSDPNATRYVRPDGTEACHSCPAGSVVRLLDAFGGGQVATCYRPVLRSLHGAPRAPLTLLAGPTVTFEPNLRYETTVFVALPCSSFTPQQQSDFVASLSFAGWKQVVVTDQPAPGGCEVVGSGIWTGTATPVDLSLQLPPGVEIRRIVRVSDGEVLYPFSSSTPVCPDPGNCPAGTKWNQAPVCQCLASTTLPQTCPPDRVQNATFQCVCKPGTVPDPSAADPKMAPCVAQSIGPVDCPPGQVFSEALLQCIDDPSQTKPAASSSGGGAGWVVGAVALAVGAVLIGVS